MWEAGLLDRREQRRVPIVVVVGLAELARKHGKLERLRSQPHDACHLGDRDVDVVDRDLVRHDQPLRADLREVVQRVVESTDRRCHGPVDAGQVPERAHLAEEHLGLDAVGIHVAQELDRVLQ